jgi:hypothetical protein
MFIKLNLSSLQNYIHYNNYENLRIHSLSTRQFRTVYKNPLLEENQSQTSLYHLPQHQKNCRDYPHRLL